MPTPESPMSRSCLFVFCLFVLFLRGASIGGKKERLEKKRARLQGFFRARLFRPILSVPAIPLP